MQRIEIIIEDKPLSGEIVTNDGIREPNWNEKIFSIILSENGKFIAKATCTDEKDVLECIKAVYVNKVNMDYATH